MTRLLLVAALVALVPQASAQTALYAEAFGPTGAYAIGIEQGLVASASDDRRLALRVGASYRTDRLFYDWGSSTDHVIAVPAGAVASFSLGRALGFPLATDLGAGVVFERRSGGRFGEVGESFGLPVYAEVLLRAGLTDRISIRAGALTGGATSPLGSDSVRPVVGLGVGL